MKKVRIFCFCLALLFCAFSYPVYAVASPAYKELISQEPVYIKEVTYSELIEYYKTSHTDDILDMKENNYIEGEVSVSGVKTMCHVYMRTFSITDISNYTLEEARSLGDRIFDEVKRCLSSKYIKCIARSYSINISGVPDKENDTYKSFTVKFLIATGESNEERAQVISEYVKPTTALWEGLDIGEKIIKLNEFLLNGQFSYDVSLINRSSIHAFIRDKKGVCEEYAGLTSLFLDELGCTNYLITGDVGGTVHMWNAVYINGRAYHLDILHNGPIDENGTHVEITREYLLVSTEYILNTRTPDEKYREICDDAIYEYIFEGAPTEIPSEIFEVVNGTMTNVPLYTTAAYFKELIGADNEFFMLLAADGTPLEDGQFVGSGCVLSLEVNGAVVESVKLYVTGDINGDGILDHHDLETIASVILRRDTEQTAPFVQFCDINGDGLVTVTDYLSFSVLGGTISL